MVTFAVGFMPILGLVSGTSVPLASPTSSSMEPTVSPGDLALVTGVNPKTLSVGDIIVYDELVQNLSDPVPSKISSPTMHRIDKIVFENNQRYFITKGDNNPTEDDWFVPKEGVQGKVVFVIPYLGNVVLALSRIDVKIAIVSITVVIIALWPNKKKKTPPKGAKK
jgi:signal peptidase